MYLVYPGLDRIIIIKADLTKALEWKKNRDNLQSMPLNIDSDELVEFLKKQVPLGVPYLKINVSDPIFTDKEFRDAWEADFSNPDGYGEGPVTVNG